MAVLIWEWAVDTPTDHNPVGVSTTIQGAMNALSKALIQTGMPSAGRVASISVRDSADGWHYVRLGIIDTARYKEGVITWKRAGMSIAALFQLARSPDLCSIRLLWRSLRTEK